MKEQDKIKELFSEKLGNYSAPVNPELWNAIAAKVAVGSAVTTTSISLLVKGLIGLGAASIIGVASYLAFSTETVQKEQLVEAQEKDKKAPTIVNEKTVDITEDKAIITDSNQPETTQSINRTLTDNQLKPIDKKVEELEESVYVPKIADAIVKKDPLNPKFEESKVKPLKEDKIVDSKLDTDVKVQPKEPVFAAEITLLPNSFTPNGDRINDEFYLEFKGELLDFNIVILDKANRTVFESKDPHFRWNGLNKQGDMTERGSYYYIVTARDINSNPINKYSSLSIER